MLKVGSFLPLTLPFFPSIHSFLSLLSIYHLPIILILLKCHLPSTLLRPLPLPVAIVSKYTVVSPPQQSPDHTCPLGYHRSKGHTCGRYSYTWPHLATAFRPMTACNKTVHFKSLVSVCEGLTRTNWLHNQEKRFQYFGECDGMPNCCRQHRSCI